MRNPDDDFHSPDDLRIPASDYVDVVTELLPQRWRLNIGPVWTQITGPIPLRRTQGWKIHLSACLDDAVRMLKVATPICTSHATEFKFASDIYRHHRLLTKNVGRQTGGKFITIYPRNDEIFSILLEALYQGCEGIKGPYILSDRQYKDAGVVFYRYGGFQSFSDTNVFGEARSLILNERFEFIEDLRLPAVHVPAFAQDAAWGQLDAGAQDEPPAGAPLILMGRFSMLATLKQSNVGGVYLADDLLSGRQVVVRETRPMTDPDTHNQDAVVRLHREHAILQLLAAQRIGPAPVALFEEWTHSFLAVEHIAGRNLRQLIASRASTLHAKSSRAELVEWLATCVWIARDLIDKIGVMHAHGIVFGDVSSNNIMVDDAARSMTLIDFETAFRVGIDLGHNAFTPGFGFRERKTRDSAGYADDLVGVGAIMLAMLIPSQCNLGLIDDFADAALPMLEADIGLPPDYGRSVRLLLQGQDGALERARALLDGIELDGVHAMPARSPADQLAQLPALRDGLVAFVEGALESRNAWRLAPPDPGYHQNTLAFDHGAAGIVFGLDRLRGGTPPDLARWLSEAAERDCETPGLMNGLAGLCWTFAQIGRHDRARDMLARLDGHKLLYADASLGYGLAGVGLCHLRLWKECADAGALAKALQIVDILRDTATLSATGARWIAQDASAATPWQVGLHGGSAGVALFLLYAYCASGRADCLTLATLALEQDLSFEATVAGSVGFPRMSHGEEGRVLYPYLEYGTAGVASVALRLYHVCPSPALLSFIERVTASIAQRYTVSAGFGGGMAGLGNYLLDAAQWLGRPALRDLAARCATALLVFRVPRGATVAVPARLGGTVSCSYLDGAIGVALFVDRLLGDGAAFHFSLDAVLADGRAHAAGRDLARACLPDRQESGA